jgi:hypothetical protein
MRLLLKSTTFVMRTRRYTAEYLERDLQEGFFSPMLGNGVGGGNGRKLPVKNLKNWRLNGTALIGMKSQTGGAQHDTSSNESDAALGYCSEQLI